MMRATRFLRGTLDARALQAARAGSSPARSTEGVRPNAPILWATLASAAVAGALIAKSTAWAEDEYKEAQLRGLLIAGLALVCASRSAARGVSGSSAIAARTACRPQSRRSCAALNPLWSLARCRRRSRGGRRWRARRAVVRAAAEPLGVARAVGDLGARTRARHGRRRAPARAGARHRTRTRATAFALAVRSTLVLMMATLLYWGGDPEARWLALTASPAFHKLDDSIRLVTDVDRDGYGSLLGENDCAPFDASIHPGAVDIPDDGIDQNSRRPRLLAPPRGRADRDRRCRCRRSSSASGTSCSSRSITVRYDHTTFGGYAQTRRSTATPRLASPSS